MSGRRGALLVLALFAAFAVGGCFQTVTEPEPVPVVPQPPAADSPAGVIERLRWAYVNRSPDVCKTLFTSDFVFAFAATDSAGNAYRNVPWVRTDELISARNLFVTGKGGEEPVTDVTLQYGNTLVSLPDPRPGKASRWHRYLNVDVVLVMKRSYGDIEIKGAAKFFVARGDSAHIPPDLGVGPDSTRWYIERWQDETAWNFSRSPDLLSAQPAKTTSWGQIKVLYR